MLRPLAAAQLTDKQPTVRDNIKYLTEVLEPVVTIGAPLTFESKRKPSVLRPVFVCTDPGPDMVEQVGAAVVVPPLPAPVADVGQQRLRRQRLHLPGDDVCPPSAGALRGFSRDVFCE